MSQLIHGFGDLQDVFCDFFRLPREEEDSPGSKKKKGERENFLQLLFKILLSKIYGQVFLLKSSK